MFTPFNFFLFSVISFRANESFINMAAAANEEVKNLFVKPVLVFVPT